MADEACRGSEVRLETARLLLRPWRLGEAAIQRQMWLERDPRVPPHRRIDANGSPTIADFEDWILASPSAPLGLLAAERKDAGAVIGYCGLIVGGRGSQDPELAFEFLQEFWGRGYATEAAWAVLEWARACGYERLRASVWEWNIASRRVLAKVGFAETDSQAMSDGTNVVTTRSL